MYMFTFNISLHLAGFPSQYSSAHEYWCGISPGTSSKMNEDGPPAQTYLHKHGVLIKDQLYYNAYLSGEMKGSRSDRVRCAEIQN